jgi:hypothetical protein
MNKQYLGDGVYAEVEYNMVKLTTENGIETTNTIYIDSEVYEAFLLYVAAVRRKEE